jgi:hypothetical protein
MSGRALAWFKSYLTRGSQQVSWYGTLSDLIEVRYGLRQESIIGPVLFLVLIGNMAKFLQISDDENVVYADNTIIWQTGRTVAEVVEKLTAKAAQCADWSRRSGLTMNASKTQLLLSANAGSCRPRGGENQTGDGRNQPGKGGGQSDDGRNRPGEGGSKPGKGSVHPGNVTVMVDGKEVKAKENIELFGVRFDRKLSTTPHARSMLTAVRQRAAVIARLANHLPRPKYLRQLATGLVNGKLGNALAAYVTPRLPAATATGEVASPSTLYHQIQVAYNRVARSITGCRLWDRISTKDLLERAGIPSLNEMIVSSVAMETWNARRSNDGGNGAKNYVGAIIFDQNRALKSTRAAAASMVEVLLRGWDTFVSNGARIWSSSKALREALTKSSARLAAKNLAARLPL